MVYDVNNNINSDFLIKHRPPYLRYFVIFLFFFLLFMVYTFYLKKDCKFVDGVFVKGDYEKCNIKNTSFTRTESINNKSVYLLSRSGDNTNNIIDQDNFFAGNLSLAKDQSVITSRGDKYTFFGSLSVFVDNALVVTPYRDGLGKLFVGAFEIKPDMYVETASYSIKNSQLEGFKKTSLEPLIITAVFINDQKKGEAKFTVVDSNLKLMSANGVDVIDELKINLNRGDNIIIPESNPKQIPELGQIITNPSYELPANE